MPAATGVQAAPIDAPSVQASFGSVPGYYLSSGTQASPEGAGLTQASLVIEPDRLIRIPGLLVGVRHVGSGSNGGYFEPMLGYRVRLDDDRRFSAAAIAYATKASGSRDGASYEAKRGGGEIGFDLRATPVSRALELHAGVSAALTALSASGQYCLESTGQHGATCAQPPVAGSLTTIEASGLYPSASVTVAADFASHFAGVFHGGRLALLLATGTMPTALAGAQKDAHWFGAAGAQLTLGFGSPR